MNKDQNEHFVADGHDRARAAHIDVIRLAVKAEYRERLKSAGWFERLRLRREMRRVIKARLNRKAPPDALYFTD
jgi:hypothetical protein